jgi:hypothetical protein
MARPAATCLLSAGLIWLRGTTRALHGTTRTLRIGGVGRCSSSISLSCAFCLLLIAVPTSREAECYAAKQQIAVAIIFDLRMLTLLSV